MNILHSKVLGKKPQHLMIVHGLFGQLDNWNTLGKKYAEHFTTHLIDLRNHGRSFHHADTSHKAMAKDLVNYMEHHRISTARFIGHSLGGKVVMELALSKPEMVEKLIVADMAPKSYPPHHQSIIAGLQNVNFNSVNNRSDVEPYLEEYIKVSAVRQFLLKNVYRTQEGNYAFRFHLNALAENYNELVTNHLPSITFEKPSLFLKGENSDYITVEDMPQIQKYFPNASVETISQAGHWLHAENPVEFLEKTVSFLKDK